MKTCMRRVWLGSAKWFLALAQFQQQCFVMMAAERQRERHCAHAGKECNKLDLTTIHCCCWSTHHTDLIGPSGLLLVVPYLFAVPVSVLMSGVEQKTNKVTKTWMWKLFLQSYILSTIGNALLTLDMVNSCKKKLQNQIMGVRGGGDALD